MKSKYFLLWVEDVSYKKDGELKPSFNHYFVDGDEKVVVRNSKEKLVNVDTEELSKVLPRVEVTVKLVEYTNKKTGQPSAFVSLEKVDIL